MQVHCWQLQSFLFYLQFQKMTLDCCFLIQQCVFSFFFLPNFLHVLTPQRIKITYLLKLIFPCFPSAVEVYFCEAYCVCLCGLVYMFACCFFCQCKYFDVYLGCFLSNTLDNNTIRCKKLATIVSGQKCVAQHFVRRKQVSTSGEI